MAFPQSAQCLTTSQELSFGAPWNRIPPQVFCDRPQRTGWVLKTELQKVRAMTEARIKSGNVPDWSWQQHVQLIEAVDAMLHDISVAEKAQHAKRYSGSPLRLVTDNPEKPRARHKIGSMH